VIEGSDNSGFAGLRYTPGTRPNFKDAKPSLFIAVYEVFPPAGSPEERL
jgi:hypothetical protein